MTYVSTLSLASVFFSALRLRYAYIMREEIVLCSRRVSCLHGDENHCFELKIHGVMNKSTCFQVYECMVIKSSNYLSDGLLVF